MIEEDKVLGTVAIELLDGGCGHTINQEIIIDVTKENCKAYKEKGRCVFEIDGVKICFSESLWDGFCEKVRELSTL